MIAHFSARKRDPRWREPQPSLPFQASLFRQLDGIGLIYLDSIFSF